MTVGVTEMKILTARALATVLDKIGPEFERQSGHRLNVVSGYGPDFLRRIDAGEPFDIIAVRLSILDRLFKDGKLIAKTRTELVRSGTGVEVRTGSPKPDVGSLEAFKRALLKAKSVGYLKIGGVPELLDRLGLTEAVKAKVTMPDTDIVSELVAQGELELGIVVITQILTTPGVELAGPLPEEIQFYSVFAGGVSVSSKAPGAAQDLIDFLRGPIAAPVIKEQGMEPL